MKNIIYISFLAVLLAACGSNNSDIEKIEVEIPVALQSNSEAKELIEDMTDAVNTCRENMVIGAKFAIEQEKSGSDSLTVKQGFKAAKFAAKMMFAAKKIEKIRAEAEEFKPELSETDWLILETKLDELEASVGNLNPEDLGLSEEEIRKLKAEEVLHLGEEENATEEVNAEDEEDLKNGMALREMEEEIMQSANTSHETAKSNDNTKSGGNWFKIALTIGFFVFAIWLVIKKVRTNIGDISYLKNDIGDKLNDVFKDPKFKDMSNEERKSVKKMKDFFE